jgi:hypothetical protein
MEQAKRSSARFSNPLPVMVKAKQGLAATQSSTTDRAHRAYRAVSFRPSNFGFQK